MNGEIVSFVVFEQLDLLEQSCVVKARVRSPAS